LKGIHVGVGHDESLKNLSNPHVPDNVWGSESMV
jgi:hypothetical protein